MAESCIVTNRPLFAVAMALWICFPIVTGCGGGDEDSPTPARGTVSGRLIVPPNQVLEEEPNHKIEQAQRVEESESVTGSSAWFNPGFSLPWDSSRRAQDLYRVTSSGPLQVALTVAANNPNLRSILMDLSGDLIVESKGFASTEVVNIPEAGDFLVGVEAIWGSSAYVLSFARVEPLDGTQRGIIPVGAEFVPGEILVRFESEKARGEGEVQAIATRFRLERKRSLAEGVELLSLSLPSQALQYKSKGSKPLTDEERSAALKAMTLDRIRRLREDPNIEYAEPNFIRRPLLFPDDPAFRFQWHYPLINLPEAWDITTGSDEIIVAVLDSGILSEHPDLKARLTDGYDFVSHPNDSNDGDGWDPDPEDPGDDPQGKNSSFHGTHVAGTVGAVTDNHAGVAGVTWQTRIMPLRVLGVDGGTDADISQAIRYAARLENETGEVPAEPAHIVNMSFGGPGSSRTVQDALLAAREQGVILVAAAGNDSSSDAYFPASAVGVISVSAVDLNLRMAPYSNFGQTIDVAAPGGDTSVDLNGDDFGDGVLSTLGDDNGAFLYVFYQGTSMAAPHVAGVIALMLSANPHLTPADIDQLLAGSHPDTTVRITQDLGKPGRDDIYGHGLIDAAQAVVAAQAIPGGGGTVPSGPILAVSTSRLNFENFLEELSFKITNAGIGTLGTIYITDNAPWLTLSRTSGTAPLTVEATVDRTGLAEGEYTATIQVSTDVTPGEQTVAILVEMEVGGRTLGNVGNAFVLVLDPESSETVAQAETDASQAYTFTTPSLAPGRYQIIAGTDLDDDGYICDIEDACGSNPELVTVVSGRNTSGIDFLLTTIASPQGSPSDSDTPELKTFRRLH